MRRLLLIISLLFNTAFVFAQKPDSAIAKPAKTRNVDGTVMTSANDLVTNITLSPQLTTLSNAIKASALTDTLRSGSITFFAPVDKAFEKLAPGLIDSLILPAHQAKLTVLLKNHALPEKITSKDILRQIKAGNGQASFTTLSGGIITARINENRNIVLTDETGDQSIITRLDIEQSNGMLFIVNAVLLPKAKQ